MALPTSTGYPTNVATTAGTLMKVYANPTTTPVAGDLLPVASEISVSHNSASESIPIYDNTGSEISVKTGNGFGFTFETIALHSATGIAAMITAGRSVGPTGEMKMAFSYPSGAFDSGIFIVEKAEFKTPVRGAQRIMFAGKSTGPVLFQV